MTFTQQLEQTLAQDLSFWGVILNTLLVIVMAQVLAWHYVHFAKVLSNKRKFARVLVFISVTTLLMISVVKTSLALSLGLVGALSIIRFRTPVKEAEELAYLFLAIAVGIGIGANQRLVTVTIFTAILIYLSLRAIPSRTWPRNRSLLQVTVPLTGAGGDTSGEKELKDLLAAVESIAGHVDLRRVDRHENTFNASLLIEVMNAEKIGQLMKKVQEALPGGSVTVVDRDNLE
jgi:hypothetical protein